MATSTARRPLPALAFLLALTVLTAIVWWRVLHRDDTETKAKSTNATTATTQSTCGVKINLPAPKAVSVQVLNGAGRDQLATQITTQLKGRGFTTAQPGNAPATIPGVGEIHYGATGKPAATLLGYYLPGAKLVSVTRSDARVDLVLGQNFTSLATAAQVNAALAKATKPC